MKVERHVSFDELVCEKRRGVSSQMQSHGGWIRQKNVIFRDNVMVYGECVRKYERDALDVP